MLLLGVALVPCFGGSRGAAAQGSGLQIVSPAPGTRVASGATISVVVSVDPRKGFRVVRVLGEDLGFTPWQKVPPAPFLLTIPPDVIGIKLIRAMGTTAPETGEFSDPVSIDVETSATLSAMEVNLAYVEFNELGEQFPLNVKGSFNDRTMLDITRSTLMTYRSDNPRVAVVGSSGMITAMGHGSTFIRVAYGTQRVNVEVAVR